MIETEDLVSPQAALWCLVSSDSLTEAFSCLLDFGLFWFSCFVLFSSLSPTQIE